MGDMTQETRDELLMAVAGGLLWLGDKDLMQAHKANVEGPKHKARLVELLDRANRERNTEAG